MAVRIRNKLAKKGEIKKKNNNLSLKTLFANTSYTGTSLLHPPIGSLT